MPGAYDVYILESEAGYRVRPAVAPVEHVNGIKVRNLTGYPVTLRFPSGVLEPINLPAGAFAKVPESLHGQLVHISRSVRTVAANGHDRFPFHEGASGVYSYLVDVETPGGPVPAEGESAPRVIVDP
jgi:hypothetical protein